MISTPFFFKIYLYEKHTLWFNGFYIVIKTVKETKEKPLSSQQC